MAYHFSLKTTLCLMLAGWRRGRAVQTQRWERLLRQEGQAVPAKVLAFLSEFGGLHVRHPHKRLRWKWDDFYIDPRRAERSFWINEEGLSEYSALVDQRLHAIGCAAHDRILLLMDQRGHVYAAMDDLLFHVAQTGGQAIESMCRGDDWQPVTARVS